MKCTRISPPAFLADFIKDITVIEGDVAEAKTFKVVVDACPGLIFQDNPEAFRIAPDKTLPAFFLHGAFTKHSEKTACQNYHNINIHFRPGAIKVIFGIDAHEFASIDNLFYKENLVERIHNTSSINNKIDIILSILTAQVNNRKSVDNRILKALKICTSNNHPLSITQLSNKLNSTERTIERLFKQHIGISPQLFLRIERFQQTLQDVRNLSINKFGDICTSHHYTDQSHFNRDFRTFTGCTPRQFRLFANEQVKNFPEYRQD